MKYYAINPYAASIFPVAIYLFAFFFPADTWRQVLFEENYVQYNWVVFFFVFLCNIFLYVGIWIGSKSSQKIIAKKPVSQSVQHTRIFPVLFVTIAVLIIFIAYLAGNFPGYLLLTVSGQANIAKQMLIDNEIKFTTIIHYAIPIVLWAYYRRLELKNESISILSCTIGLAVFLVLTIAFVNAARYLILPVILGLYVIYAKLRQYDKIPVSRHLKVSIRNYFLLLVSVVVIFGIFSFLRGSEDLNEVYSSVLGYGPVSYNRLAMQLQGKLLFDFSGTGVYVIPDPILSLWRLVSGAVPMSGNDVWTSEFNSVGKVGLNADFIWLTVYGYTFDSIGMFAPIYFLLFGIFSGITWRSFISGRVFGIVFYPFVFFSIFFFFGSNYLSIYFQYYLIIFIVLSSYEWLISTLLTRNR